MTELFNPIDVARRLRKLRRAGLITASQYVIGDNLLWACGSGPERQVSYAKLAKLAGVVRSTAQKAVARLRYLGVLSWRQTRLRFAWGRGLASRQWKNVYRLSAGPHTDTDQTAATCRQASKKDCIEGERRVRLRPHPPIRSVAEQLALLLSG